MRYFLNAIYTVLLLVLSPWLAYTAVRTGKYREGWGDKLLGLVPKLAPSTSRRYWFHAVSVGEVNLLISIVKRLRKASPNIEIVVSTTTKTGFDLAKRRFSDHTVCYCPLDFTWAVDNAIQRLKPDMLVLVELELWPNLLLAADRNEIPVAIVNGRLSDRSTRGYLRLSKWLPGPIQKILDCITVVGAQSELCADRFIQLGIPSDRVHLTGSVKFDGAETDRQNPLSQELRQLANFTAEQKVFVAGSTQAPEEEYALAAFLQLTNEFPQLRLVLVPRHPERSHEVARLLDKSGIPWRRRKQLAANAPLSNEKVILVDTVGELGGWWGCADVGFVGGSMGKRGGQNMLEPSGFGVATCFGPKTKNFRDVVQRLLSANAAVVVHDAPSMLEFVRRCLTDHSFGEGLGQRAQQIVLSQRGATDATIRIILRCAAHSPSDVPHFQIGNSTQNAKPDTSPLRRSA